MKFKDLSPEDQALVRTNFGAMDKVAEAQVKEAAEAYEYGAETYAKEIADNLDKIAAEEAAEVEKVAGTELTEEQEKSAAELGAFIEKGVCDGLAKLGQERHNDPMHYFVPFVEEKIAEAGAKAALNKAYSKMKDHAGAFGARAKAMLQKGKGHAAAAGAKAKGAANAAGEKAKAHGKKLSFGGGLLLGAGGAHAAHKAKD